MNCPYKGKFKVTSPQGYRTLNGKREYHDGLDLVGLDSKTIYSTVSGVVEVASWENSKNKKQGFGQYVRIKKNNSSDRYYFGHLSEISVKKGQKVECGDVLGIEGNTGYSTGSHCHYCVRGNCLKSQVRNITDISGIPNKKGTYKSETEAVKTDKTITELANEVLNGVWGNGADRKKRLSEAGYDYSKVQAEVNRIAKSKKTTSAKKSDTAIAKEVIKGLWGNGASRKAKLTAAGYNYSKIQELVNEMLGGK